MDRLPATAERSGPGLRKASVLGPAAALVRRNPKDFFNDTRMQPFLSKGIQRSIDRGKKIGKLVDGVRRDGVQIASPWVDVLTGGAEANRPHATAPRSLFAAIRGSALPWARTSMRRRLKNAKLRDSGFGLESLDVIVTKASGDVHSLRGTLLRSTHSVGRKGAAVFVDLQGTSG